MSKQEVTELEAAQLASAFRPNRKPLIVALAANILLALALLGVPYWRGRVLAADMRVRFAELSRCLMGGEIAERPGLSLPQGDRDQFAAKALLAQSSWPLSCRPALQRLAPEPAIFLWPSVKRAAADLRAAVELAEREIATLARQRQAGLRRVPERPLAALRKVQAATVLLARAGGAEQELDNDAIRWLAAPALAMPARLPLTASGDASLDLYSDGSALEALALDGRGVSYLRVNDGKIDRERVRRTSFVRGVVRAGADARIVWAMPDARCAERDDHCSRRPLGMSPYEQGGSALAEPVWKLAGHPAGRVDRALSVSASGRVWLLARTSPAGALDLLRFDLPERTTPAPGTAAPPPIESSAHFAVRAEPPQIKATAPDAAKTSEAEKTTETADASKPAQIGKAADATAKLGAAAKLASGPAITAGEATLIDGETVAVLLAEQTTDGVGAKLVWADATRAPVVLPAIGASVPAHAAGPAPSAPAAASTPGPQPSAGSADAWTLGCSVAGSVRVAYGSSTQLKLMQIEPAGVPRELLTHAAQLLAPIHLEDRGLDHVRLICDAERTQLLFIDAARALWVAACNGESCAAPRKLASDTLSVAPLLTSAGSVIALGSPADEVRILRLDLKGEPTAPAYAPAACFEPLSGMCGTPTLIADAQRLVLAARDRSDLLALESTDGGASFVTLSGVISAARIEQSTTKPLEQHRIRKGLD